MSSAWPCTVVGGAEGMAGCTWGVVYTRAGEEACLDKGNMDLLGPLLSIQSGEVEQQT